MIVMKERTLYLFALIIVAHGYIVDAWIEYALHNYQEHEDYDYNTSRKNKDKAVEMFYSFEGKASSKLAQCNLQMTQENENDMLTASIYLALTDANQRPWVLLMYLVFKFTTLYTAKLFAKGSLPFYDDPNFSLSQDERKNCAQLALYLMSFAPNIPTDVLINELHVRLADLNGTVGLKLETYLSDIRDNLKRFETHVLKDDNKKLLKAVINNPNTLDSRTIFPGFRNSTDNTESVLVRKLASLLFRNRIVGPRTPLARKLFYKKNLEILRKAGDFLNTRVEDDDTQVNSILRSIELERMIQMGEERDVLNRWLKRLKLDREIKEFSLGVAQYKEYDPNLYIATNFAELPYRPDN